MKKFFICLSLILFFTARSEAAITLITANQYFSGDTNGFTSATFDSTGGNTVVVLYTGVEGTHPITDNKSNTYTAGTACTGFFGTRVAQWYYATSATTGTGHTVTVTATGLAPTLHVLVYSGADTLDAGKESCATASAATLQAGSLTPSVNDCVALSGLYFNDITSMPLSINGGFTKETQTTDTNFGHLFGASADLIQTTATAFNPTWTASASDSVLIAANMVIKPSGGAPSFTPGLMTLGAK